jgi:hypothetical protein
VLHECVVPADRGEPVRASELGALAPLEQRSERGLLRALHPPERAVPRGHVNARQALDHGAHGARVRRAHECSVDAL